MCECVRDANGRAMALRGSSLHQKPLRAQSASPEADERLQTAGRCAAAAQVNNNRAVLTYVGVAERLLRMHRSAAARFRQLFRPPHDQQHKRAKDAVDGKRHFLTLMRLFLFCPVRACLLRRCVPPPRGACSRLFTLRAASTVHRGLRTWVPLQL